MNRNIYASDTIGYFSAACMKSNELISKLTSIVDYIWVKRSSHISSNEEGWILENFVEATLCKSTGMTAVWASNFRFRDKKWIFSAYFEITEDNTYIEFPDIFAENINEIREGADKSVNYLLDTLRDGSEVIDKIKKFSV